MHLDGRRHKAFCGAPLLFLRVLALLGEVVESLRVSGAGEHRARAIRSAAAHEKRVEHCGGGSHHHNLLFSSAHQHSSALIGAHQRSTVLACLATLTCERESRVVAAAPPSWALRCATRSLDCCCPASLAAAFPCMYCSSDARCASFHCLTYVSARERARLDVRGQSATGSQVTAERAPRGRDLMRGLRQGEGR